MNNIPILSDFSVNDLSGAVLRFNPKESISNQNLAYLGYFWARLTDIKHGNETFKPYLFLSESGLIDHFEVITY